MKTATKRAKQPATCLTDEQLDQVFERAQDQADALIALYRLAIPNWDDVESVDGWPSCNDATWKGIAQRFVDFDKRVHPDVFAGGLWLNRGFSTSHGGPLKDGVISLQGVKLTMKGGAS